MAEEQEDVVLVVPAELGGVLVADGVAEPHDLYRGVDIPVEVILTGMSVAADTVGLISARPMLNSVIARIVSWVRGGAHPDEVELKLRRGASTVSLQVTGPVDEKALKDAISALLDSA